MRVLQLHTGPVARCKHITLPRAAVNNRVASLTASRLTKDLQKSRKNSRVHAANSGSDTPSTSSAVVTGDGKIVDVEGIVGVRIVVDDDGNARAEYLVRWKDGHPDTWEQQKDLADNVLRDFENKWWTVVKQGDEATIQQLLEGGGKALARAVSEEGRSALHFAAALGKVGATKMLCEAGAVVDAQDKDGYTALHMATGYLHTATMKVLLEYGADPEIEDRNGRSPLGLADNIRKGMPNVPELLSRRMALDNCSGMLTDVLYEDLEPAAVLDVREEEGKEKEYLVRWPDDADDTWVPASQMSSEIIEEFEKGIEYVDALEILDMRQKGDNRRFLIRWSDGAPDSWEPEEHVSASLIEQYLQNREAQKQAAKLAAQQHAAGAPAHNNGVKEAEQQKEPALQA